MTLSGDTSALVRPGQFVNFLVEGCYLRRPISVCDWDGQGNWLTVIYKVVGKGTEIMARMAAGDQLDTLAGLGNGYDTSKSGSHPVLIGGGVGIPPLYGLAKRLVQEGKEPLALLGFRTAEEVFLQKAFSALCPVIVTTQDGSAGRTGLVTDVLGELDYTFFYTCGPMPMFMAVEKAVQGSGQYSFEEKMGCGFGACMGCSCKTKYGSKRICKDGPVLEREEIVW